MEGRHSQEEEYLNAIIASCQQTLESLKQGASISPADFNCLGYADGVLFKISQNTTKSTPMPKELKPFSDIIADQDLCENGDC